MPGTYSSGKFDIAGFSVGIVEKHKILKGKIKKNDIILGVPSSGIHSNGYSLVRDLIKKKKININQNKFLKKELLKPTKIYVNEVLSLLDKNILNGCANITGGGLKDNIKRVIPNNLCAEIDLSKIKTLKIFKWLKNSGIKKNEMLKTFNCGVGFCLIINKKNLQKVKKCFLSNFNLMLLEKFLKILKESKLMVKLNGKKINTAIFISGRGSNLKSLINFFKKKNSPILIKLIVSNNPKAKGLIYAKKSKINKYIINFKNKKISEKNLLKKLLSNNINLICLAGFMKILSGNFIKNFTKPILNIHPSLLPKYKGLNTHKRVIKNKEKYSGSTVHLVTAKLDSGKIILQKKIKISKNENEKSLEKKILKIEHKLYPKAIKKFLNSNL